MQICLRQGKSKDGDIDIVLKSVLIYKYHYSGVTRKGEMIGVYKLN